MAYLLRAIRSTVRNHSGQSQLPPKDFTDETSGGLLGNEMLNAGLRAVQRSEALGRIQRTVIGTA
jgi:hypothetical protein